jgi:hypothetical protein
MTSPQDSVNQKLSFTRDNRHQYLETAMVSASDAEREIMQAEARGRERRVREVALKRQIQNIATIAAVVVVLSVVAGLIFWATR